MTTINVRDETGRNSQLAEDMSVFLAKAAPYVEQITGLVLPHTVTVRLLTVPDRADAVSAFIRRQLERDTTGVELTAHERKKVAALPVDAGRAAHTLWAVDASVLVANTVGWPSTLIVPVALAHQGLLSDPDGLCELLVRVLTEQAQVEACRGALVPGGAWPPVRKDRSPVAQLSAGHACWAGRRTTPLVLGKPVSDRPRRPSWTYRRQAALVFLRERGQRGRRLLRSTAFVEQAMDSIGPEGFNALWTMHELVPTLDELRHPDQWLRRQSA
ncbi:zinc-dependent metalloprotease [Streptomyces bottropensis]|uniref:zinc-dependent metalloprotease n=1 Tax=Streptomyces bottropensis TaxID=42235 RepID=UPI003680DF66